jgi:hypothetical protein
MRLMVSSLASLALDSSFSSQSENGARAIGLLVILSSKILSATGCINVFQAIGLGCTRLTAMGGSASAKATSRIAFDTACGGIQDTT